MGFSYEQLYQCIKCPESNVSCEYYKGQTGVCACYKVIQNDKEKILQGSKYVTFTGLEKVLNAIQNEE